MSKGRADGKGGLSARSVVYHHRILSKALDYAVKMGVVVRNVADVVQPPRLARAVVQEAEKVVVLTGQVELVTHRVGAEVTIHHQRSKGDEGAPRG